MVRGERHARSKSALMLPLSFSYDHRLVDGAAAGRFLNEVIDLLTIAGKTAAVGEGLGIGGLGIRKVASRRSSLILYPSSFLIFLIPNP